MFREISGLAATQSALSCQGFCPWHPRSSMITFQQLDCTIINCMHGFHGQYQQVQCAGLSSCSNCPGYMHFHRTWWWFSNNISGSCDLLAALGVLATRMEVELERKKKKKERLLDLGMLEKYYCNVLMDDDILSKTWQAVCTMMMALENLWRVVDALICSSEVLAFFFLFLPPVLR